MEKVNIHVNKYIPLYMQYHEISKSDMNEFAKDY